MTRTSIIGKQFDEERALYHLQKAETRETLLNGIHRNQSCIEFLDDVLCRMRKEGT